MINTIRAWFIQKYIKFLVMRTPVLHQTLFDFNGGMWEEVTSGSSTEYHRGLVRAQMNRMFKRDPEAIAVVTTYVFEDTGFIMARTLKSYYDQFFHKELFSFEAAMYEIDRWCTGGDDGKGQQKASEKTA